MLTIIDRTLAPYFNFLQLSARSPLISTEPPLANPNTQPSLHAHNSTSHPTFRLAANMPRKELLAISAIKALVVIIIVTRSAALPTDRPSHSAFSPYHGQLAYPWRVFMFPSAHLRQDLTPTLPSLSSETPFPVPVIPLDSTSYASHRRLPPHPHLTPRAAANPKETQPIPLADGTYNVKPYKDMPPEDLAKVVAYYKAQSQARYEEACGEKADIRFIRCTYYKFERWLGSWGLKGETQGWVRRD